MTYEQEIAKLILETLIKRIAVNRVGNPQADDLKSIGWNSGLDGAIGVASALNITKILEELPAPIPVEYQWRTRVTWEGSVTPWSPWASCSKSMYDQYKRSNMQYKGSSIGEYEIEVRKLYDTPQPDPNTVAQLRSKLCEVEAQLQECQNQAALVYHPVAVEFVKLEAIESIVKAVAELPYKEWPLSEIASAEKGLCNLLRVSPDELRAILEDTLVPTAPTKSSVQAPQEGSEGTKVATIEITAAGPRLYVFGVLVRTWIGNYYNSEVAELARQINEAKS